MHSQCSFDKTSEAIECFGTNRDRQEPVALEPRARKQRVQAHNHVQAKNELAYTNASATPLQVREWGPRHGDTLPYMKPPTFSLLEFKGYDTRTNLTTGRADIRLRHDATPYALDHHIYPPRVVRRQLYGYRG